jgi:thiol-disulfide isomerase/thioredoxin
MRLITRTLALAALLVVLSAAKDLLSAPRPADVLGETKDPLPASEITTLPSLDGAATWLNGPPLTAAALKGHVVIVDFWTFLCSNCQAALPYVRKLDADFRDKGLITIGVHTPELAPERDINNVRKALTKLGVTYPVPVDPEFTIWNRFNNRYWPSIYIFDKTGKLRYHFDGEGDYAEQRALVQRLLAE